MLQLMLSNTEKAQLRAAVLDMKGTIEARGNAPLPEWEMRRNTQLCTEHFNVLCKLKALLPQTKREGELGRAARVEFVRTIWLAGILPQIRDYAFYDVFLVGDREYGTCFESGDADEVMNELVRKAKRSKNLRAAALEIYSPEAWQGFESTLARSRAPKH